MKKVIKKFTVLLLAAIMLFSVAVPAFAATLDNVKQYNSYFVIGDSVSRGCGLDGYYDNDACLRCIEGSFPYILAQAIGCKDASQRYAMNYSGQRTVETLYCLGEDIDLNDAYDTDYFTEKLASMVSHKDEYIESCKNADLVTIELGTNDVFFSSFALIGMSDFDFSKLQAGDLLSMAATLISAMWNGYSRFYQNMPRVIERVRELNPSCDIVLVGVYNPIENLPITNELFIPVGNVATIITSFMNGNLKTWARQYGVKFADIEDVETPASSSEITFISDEFLHNGAIPTHPTQEGLYYIARQIADQLPSRTPVVEKAKKTDIVVDLGSFCDISCVLIDGRFAEKYSYYDHNLYVSNNSKNNLSMTVLGRNDAGHLYVYVYLLSYNKDTGYETKRLFSTNDFEKTVDRVLMLLTYPTRLFYSALKK